MNIQISVVIWTVICFLALVLILKHLLFTPMLRHMDARKARIDAAREKRKRLETLRLEGETAAREAEAAAAELAKQEAERIIAKETARGEAELADKAREEKAATAAYAQTLEREMTELAKETEAAAVSLGEVLVSGFLF